MTVPGVGHLTAQAFVASIDDPARFTSSRNVGAYFGLTTRRYQSGERDVSGRISKIGDSMTRSLLYSAASAFLLHVERPHPVTEQSLSSTACLKMLLARPKSRDVNDILPMASIMGRASILVMSKCSTGVLRSCAFVFFFCFQES